MAADQPVAETVTTHNHGDPNDGISVTYTVSPEQPQGAEGGAAVKLANGQWASPAAESLNSSMSVDQAVANDVLDRGRSFVEAGQDLKWNAHKPTPINNQIIHGEDSKPYGVTCSSFIAMVMQGWDYNNTTYVADENRRVGSWVDFGDAGDIWQAHKLASWLYDNGDLLAATNMDDLRPGDILFFSKQNPEGAGTTGTYFGNIYHTALYVGDGTVIHSYGPGSETGVVEGKLGQAEQRNLSFVARPDWHNPNDPGSSANQNQKSEQSDRKSSDSAGLASLSS